MRSPALCLANEIEVPFDVAPNGLIVQTIRYFRGNFINGFRVERATINLQFQ